MELYKSLESPPLHLPLTTPKSIRKKSKEEILNWWRQSTQHGVTIIGSPLFYAATGELFAGLGLVPFTRPMVLAGTIMLASSSIAKASSV